MHTAPAWVIKPHFRQGEITLTNGGAKGNKRLPKTAKMAKMVTAMAIRMATQMVIVKLLLLILKILLLMLI